MIKPEWFSLSKSKNQKPKIRQFRGGLARPALSTVHYPLSIDKRARLLTAYRSLHFPSLAPGTYWIWVIGRAGTRYMLETTYN